MTTAVEIIDRVIEHFSKPDARPGIARDASDKFSYYGGARRETCAIGCLLKHPKALQTYANESSVYAIDSMYYLLENDSSEYRYLMEDIEALFPKEFDQHKALCFLGRLQTIHDSAADVYLEDAKLHHKLVRFRTSLVAKLIQFRTEYDVNNTTIN